MDDAGYNDGVAAGPEAPSVRAMVDLSPAPLAVFGADGAVRALNPVATALFEVLDPEAVAALRNALSQAVTHPDRAVPVRLHARLEGRVRCFTGRLVNRRHDPSIGGVLMWLADVTVEATVAEVARDLLTRGHRDLDACITEALRRACELSGADRVSVFLVHDNGLAAELAYEWTTDPALARADRLRHVPLDAVPRLVEIVLESRATVVDLEERPDLERDAAAIGASDTGWCALAPLVMHDRLAGCITLESIGAGRTLQSAALPLVDQLAPIVAAAVERDHVEREFRDAQMRFEQAWAHAPIGMVMLSGEGRLLRANPAYCDLLGYTDRELVGAPLRELVHPDDLGDFDANVSRVVSGAHDRFQLELRLSQRLPVAGDLWTWCRASVSLVHDGSGGAYLIGQIEDITDRRVFEARLAYEATHDELTGLPLRKPLLVGLERALANAARRGTSVAVLFVDLDDFKRVNDTLGHAAGDDLLRLFAGRLQGAVRASDMAARLGGDEFAVMCTELNDPDAVFHVARRVLELVERPFPVAGTEVKVGASVGIALAGSDADANTVLRQADSAAYLAKERGRNRYEIFDATTRPSAPRVRQDVVVSPSASTT